MSAYTTDQLRTIVETPSTEFRDMRDKKELSAAVETFSEALRAERGLSQSDYFDLMDIRGHGRMMRWIRGQEASDYGETRVMPFLKEEAKKRLLVQPEPASYKPSKTAYTTDQLRTIVETPIGEFHDMRDKKELRTAVETFSESLRAERELSPSDYFELMNVPDHNKMLRWMLGMISSTQGMLHVIPFLKEEAKKHLHVQPAPAPLEPMPKVLEPLPLPSKEWTPLPDGEDFYIASQRKGVDAYIRKTNEPQPRFFVVRGSIIACVQVNSVPAIKKQLSELKKNGKVRVTKSGSTAVVLNHVELSSGTPAVSLCLGYARAITLYKPTSGLIQEKQAFLEDRAKINTSPKHIDSKIEWCLSGNTSPAKNTASKTGSWLCCKSVDKKPDAHVTFSATKEKQMPTTLSRQQADAAILPPFPSSFTMLEYVRYVAGLTEGQLKVLASHEAVYGYYQMKNLDLQLKLLKKEGVSNRDGDSLISPRLTPHVSPRPTMNELAVRKVQSSQIHQLGTKLGQGTFGSVFKCQLSNTDGDKEVGIYAVKNMIPGTKTLREFQDICCNEVSTLLATQLGHPNIIEFFAYCDDKPTEWKIVTKLYDGGNLHNFMNKEHVSTMTFDDAVRMAHQMAEALNFLHQATDQKPKIYHRDIKPANILLTKRAHDADVIFADFGLGHVFAVDPMQGAETFISDGVAGSLLYMAPEVLDEEKAIRWSKADVYSLGVVLWELFYWQATKKHAIPFSGNVKKRIKDSRITPGEYSDIPNAHVQDILILCLKFDRVQRPSAAEVADLLRQLRSTDDMDNVRYICAWVRQRIETSETIYRIGRRKQTMEDMRRFAFILDHLESDVKTFWNKTQREMIRGYIETGAFCSGIENETELQKLQPAGLGPKTTNCIYMWRSNTTGRCYIGKTDRVRKRRDYEHRRGSTTFDKEVQRQGVDNWSTITLCQYKTTTEMNRLEPLHVLVFNTSLDRGVKSMGYNTDVGGDFGASVFKGT